jgi:hypothetical protein
MPISITSSKNTRFWKSTRSERPNGNLARWTGLMEPENADQLLN